MLGYNKIIKSKKGFVFTAAVMFFVITILIFSTLIYKNTEKKEQSLITDSLSLRMRNMEDSLQQAIKKTFIISYNLDLSIEKTNSIEELSIKTKLNDYGKTQKNLNSSLDNLQTNFNYFYPDSNVNISSLKDDPKIYLKNNLIIEKNTINNTNDKHHNLTILFNESGTNTNAFYNITLIINSTDNFEHIVNQTSLPTGTTHNLIIKAKDTDGNPIGVPKSEINTTIPFTLPSNHQWTINNEDNSTTFINITLDSEKISVISNYGNATLIAKINYEHNNITPLIYHPTKEIIKLDIKQFNITKTANYESTIN